MHVPRDDRPSAMPVMTAPEGRAMARLTSSKTRKCSAGVYIFACCALNPQTAARTWAGNL
jgi:hypothetical protein